MTVTATDYRDRTQAAILRGHNHSREVEVSGYPEDVTELIGIVCELWYLKPPTTKKSKAYWIASSRELLDACGEFGPELIREYRLEFERKMREIKERTGYGCAPHTVEGPGSLVKMVRDLAGRKRAEFKQDTLDTFVYMADSMEDDGEFFGVDYAAPVDATWQAVRDHMEETMSVAYYSRYVQPCKGAYDGKRLTVVAPDEYTREWISDRIGKRMTDYLQGITNNEDAELLIVVAAEE